MSVDVDENPCLDDAMFVVQVFVFSVTAGKHLAVSIVLTSLKNVSRSTLSNRSRSTSSNSQPATNQVKHNKGIIIMLMKDIDFYNIEVYV